MKLFVPFEVTYSFVFLWSGSCTNAGLKYSNYVRQKVVMCVIRSIPWHTPNWLGT